MTTAGQAEVFSSGDANWPALLARVPHDVYHRPEYHLLTGFGHLGTPRLFAYREACGLFLWPYLERPIPGSDQYDVSSVYGYAGPVCQGDVEFLQRGWRALVGHWRDASVVAAFTRLHPLLENSEFVGDWQGDSSFAPEGLCAAGTTISIDLTISAEEQVRRYQKVLRQEIRKSREAGFVTSEDYEWTELDSFVRLYRQTMERRNSRPEYLVDAAWVERFRAALGSHARLFVTKWQGRVAAALLAIEYGPFLHAHLTGIEPELAAHSPLKILLDDTRIWGTERGLRSFHLGGGLGGGEDSLFQFKRRFSPVTHAFKTGRWVLDRSRYRELERMHQADWARRGFRVENPGFFPVYRYQPTQADAVISDSHAMAGSGLLSAAPMTS